MSVLSSSWAPWLEARYPYDARARNREIERIVRGELAGRPLLRLVDLGAGLGANVRYYAEIFDGDQEWHCLERDRGLCRLFKPRLKKWGACRGWSGRETSQGLFFLKNGKKVAVRLLRSSFLPFPDELARLRPDLATANAVFDLLTTGEFLGLAAALSGRAIPLLATLNYASMRFVPSSPADRRIVALYESHMTKPGSNGAAMGPGCARTMEGILKDAGYRVLKKESHWRISRQDGRLLDLLLRYIEAAVMSSPAAKIEGGEMRAWAAGKRAGVGSGEVEVRITHLDFYASIKKK
jgi:hypothetical protein